MLDFIFIAASDAWDEVIRAIAGFNKSLFVFATELELFLAIYLAHFIVWRELRKRRELEQVLMEEK